MRGPHEDAVHRTRLNTESTKHAFRIINRVTGDPKALPAVYAFFADIDAINGTSLGTLIASDTGRQVKTVKANR